MAPPIVWATLAALALHAQVVQGIAFKHRVYRADRARRKHITGTSEHDIAQKFNKFVSRHASVSRVLPCSSLSAGEADALRLALLPRRGVAAQRAWGADDGRQLAIPLQLRDAGALQQATLRDALCAETLKLWAHHLPASAKAVAANLTLPTMPIFNKTDWTDPAGRLYEKSLSCITGHSAPDIAPDSPWPGWPSWPLRGHFVSSGHGPFPFWHFGAGPELPNAMGLNVSLSRPHLYNPGTPMEVWYDMSRNTTKFYHAKCDWILLDIHGLGERPCNHFMTGDFPSGRWYTFTADPVTKRGDGEFCCDDGFSVLGTMNPRFMDSMWYFGEVNFTGDYYTGRARRYQSRMKSFERASAELGQYPPVPPETSLNPTLLLDVWYETDLQDRPLRFAEAASADVDNPNKYTEGGFLTSDDFPLIYTEYDMDSWQSGGDAISAEDLELPDVCKKSALPTCKVPGDDMTHAQAANLPAGERWPECAFDLQRAFADALPGVGDEVICDRTMGTLMHTGTGHIRLARPFNGCHEYVVLASAAFEGLGDVGQPRFYDVGQRHETCLVGTSSSVLAEIAVANCSSIGSRCPQDTDAEA